jgi:ankyrin repeat protein
VDNCGQSYSQQTPLMLAANGAHERAMEVLLDHGADDTLVSTDGMTVADRIAVWRAKMH